MIDAIEAPCLAQPGIRHGFFTRAGGVSKGIYAGLNCGPGSADDPDHVATNRARAADHLGARHSDIVTLYQVHGATALCVEGPVPINDRPKADAVVTSTRGLAVGVLTADCAPVLFADSDARVVAAAHAGWRGAVAGILEATIAEMQRQGARRGHIVAAIGPAINQVSYEVSPEFEADLIKDSPDNGRFFARAHPDARPHFDLPGYVQNRLLAGGLGRVERHSPCTYANESLFYSYRRSQHLGAADYGRQISAIVVA